MMMRRVNKSNLFQQLKDYLEENKLDLFQESLQSLHIQDQVDWFQKLDDKRLRQKVYSVLTPEQLADILQGLEIDEQKNVMDEMDRNKWIATLNEMASDDVADYLTELSEQDVNAALGEMDQVAAKRVKKIMEYQEETAGALMATEYIAIKTTDTVQSVMSRLRDEAPEAETIYYIYVTDTEGSLVGVVSLRDLITNEPEVNIEDVMSTRVVSVKVNQDQEEVARLIQKYDFLAVPVITDDNKLVGIITVDDILDVIEEEATEDFGEISAVRGATGTDVTAWDAAKKRAPWIIMLMFLGLITAEVIGQFEETLEAIVILAAFIPLIMDSAGNTGTQSLAVMVRNLAIGTFDKRNVWRVLRREFFTGVMIGLGSAVTLAILIIIFYDQNLALAGVVGTSILLTLSISTLTGSIIPLIIDKFKIDPAVASGPFITTLNDIMGLLIYFTIATSMIHYLM
ncbi:magnesium transporter [Alkalibacillus haloalkaliphilus]|uniref:Magnesium transporter MgtE n=1 Tax=Alkalibacillus haloalkaliphilus TaxID=94136 RepID=A0A511W646_9BACI|nr:magnesium transporter [Alkalibacillus haloalkaliphilus]GEN46221.1 magnesium transporter MgtE [Alkalibacillus haloalkaliphilus]